MPYDKSKLTELREGRFTSQGEAAKAIGVSQATLSRWESGEAEPSGEYRTAYASALGIQVAELGRVVYAPTSVLLSASTPRPSPLKRTRRGKR